MTMQDQQLKGLGVSVMFIDKIEISIRETRLSDVGGVRTSLDLSLASSRRIGNDHRNSITAPSAEYAAVWGSCSPPATRSHPFIHDTSFFRSWPRLEGMNLRNIPICYQIYNIIQLLNLQYSVAELLLSSAKSPSTHDSPSQAST